eukprot:maker-scaffold_8-snap-gene-8.65-mRNA-1 protein AED:0.01 eAED:0.01 QI:36/1/1/1/1/1/2/89/186
MIFEDKPLLKMLLHGGKHPTEAVIGVLLGKKDEMKVLDAIPMFHNAVLSPVLEVGVSFVEELCKQENLEVLGMYFMHELNNFKPESSAFPGYINKLSTELSTYFKNKDFLTLGFSNESVAGKIKEGVKLFNLNHERVAFDLIGDGIDNKFDVLLQKEEETSFAKFADFEDWLETPSLDFTNSYQSY